MEFFKTNKIYDFVKYGNVAIIISLLLILGSLALIIIKDFKLGIDFAGGSIVQIQYPDSENAPIAQIREILGKDERFNGFQVSEFGSPNEVLLKLPLFGDSDSENLFADELDSEISESGSLNAPSAAQIISEVLADTGNFEIRRENSIGAKIGDEFKKKGIIAMLLALVAMMIYVSLRYEWRFALAGILALAHDAIIVSGAVIVMDIDFNLEVLAALLTIIGYSINDTIIIFDRIREQMLAKRAKNMSYVINEAVSRTLSRTTLTSLSTFFVIFTLFVFGGEIIKGFSAPMLVGVIVATFSSIFVAPRLAVIMGFNLDDYYKKELNKAKKAEEKKRLRAMYEKGVV